MSQRKPQELPTVTNDNLRKLVISLTRQNSEKDTQIESLQQELDHTKQFILELQNEVQKVKHSKPSEFWGNFNRIVDVNGKTLRENATLKHTIAELKIEIANLQQNLKVANITVR